MALKRIGPTESQLQAMIVEGLRWKGYEVLEIGRFVRSVGCPGCKRWFTPKTGYGNTPGSPDLLISHTSWPDSSWLAVELKTPDEVTPEGIAKGGRLRPEQKILADKYRTSVCRSFEDVENAISNYEDHIA